MNQDPLQVCNSTEILNKANLATLDLLPKISRIRYEQEYQLFLKWREDKKVVVMDEDCMLAYMSEKSKVFKASSLWSKYSMLKAVLRIMENVDIGTFAKVSAFLKRQSEGYLPKKSKVFEKEHLIKFLTESPDDIFLMIKVVVIFGVYGACRKEEMYNLSVEDIRESGETLFVTLHHTKNKKNRVFAIISEGENGINGVELYKKYAALRPCHTTHNKVFIYYKNNKCSVQRVGMNTFGKIPQKIATFLGLLNPELYTGHCFRRSSATLLADGGSDLVTLKRHGGWASSRVAENYIEDSDQSKSKIAKMLLGSCTSTVTTKSSAAVIPNVASTVTTKSSAAVIPNVATVSTKTDVKSNTFSPYGTTFQNNNITHCEFHFHGVRPEEMP